jgi:hypothetical protein
VQINKGIYETAHDGTVVLLSDGQRVWNEADDQAPQPDAVTTVQYVCAKGSNIYHFADCADAKKIKPENLLTSDAPFNGKQLHRGCPR